jgi:hypothetical protein
MLCYMYSSMQRLQNTGAPEAAEQDGSFARTICRRLEGLAREVLVRKPTPVQQPRAQGTLQNQGTSHIGERSKQSDPGDTMGDTKTFNHTGLLGRRRASQGQHLQ